MARKGYVFLFEKVIAAADTSASSRGGLSPLTPAEQRRLDELEEDLPLQTIIMFRTMARKEVRVPGVVGSKCHGSCWLLSLLFVTAIGLQRSW